MKKIMVCVCGALKKEAMFLEKTTTMMPSSGSQHEKDIVIHDHVHEDRIGFASQQWCALSAWHHDDVLGVVPRMMMLFMLHSDDAELDGCSCFAA